MRHSKTMRFALALVAGVAPLSVQAQTTERELGEVRVEDKAAPYTSTSVQVGTFRDTDPLDSSVRIRVQNLIAFE